MHWVKPRLNLSLFNGSRANNILWPREDYSACMGTAYAKCLKASVSFVWTKLPALLPLADPTLFIPLVCTLGGLIVGLLAVSLPA